MNMFILNKYDMINIVKNNNNVVISIDKKEYMHPLSTLFTHVNKDSESIDIRYKASRKNAYSFNYKDVANPSGANAEDVQKLIAKLLE